MRQQFEGFLLSRFSRRAACSYEGFKDEARACLAHAESCRQAVQIPRSDKFELAACRATIPPRRFHEYPCPSVLKVRPEASCHGVHARSPTCVRDQFRRARGGLRPFRFSHFGLAHDSCGIEPKQLALVELEGIPLGRSGKLSWNIYHPIRALDSEPRRGTAAGPTARGGETCQCLLETSRRPGEGAPVCPCADLLQKLFCATCLISFAN